MFALSYLLFFLISLFFSDVHDEITVISYNIRYDNPDDGVNRWDLRKEKVVNYLIESGSDMIGMQEVLYHQLHYLNQELKEFSYTGVGREDGKIKGEFSPIVYNFKNLKLEETSTFWLSETPEEISIGWDAALERICTYARFEHIQTGKQFWVFNTHFDHRGDNAREESVKLILKKIKALNDMRLPIIITGDFNLTPETQPIKILQNSFQDVLASLTPSEKKYGTFTGFDKNEIGTDRIDYIFYKAFQLKTANHIWVRTEKGTWASDHHPVQATFLFKK
ncbi:MAG: endonuclease/exonuclease/phosphatase family protein [Flavobacteriaceae bacterium]